MSNENPKDNPGEQRPDSVPAQWPGEHTLPPGTEKETETTAPNGEPLKEKTIIPLVR